MKLNLGCGNKTMAGYINIDLSPEAEVQADLREPLYCEDSTAEEIYAKHIVEHFTEKEWEKILPDWVRVLKDGGLLTIECPDVARCMANWILDKEGRRDYWSLTILGQDAPGMSHKNMFYLEKLIKDLTDNGFVITGVSWLYDETPDIGGFNIKISAILKKGEGSGENKTQEKPI